MKLSRKATEIYNKIKNEYSIDDSPGLLLLRTGMEAYDEMRAAQKEVNGKPVFHDRFGQPAEHPGCKVVRASRTQMIAAFRALKLDLGAEDL